MAIDLIALVRAAMFASLMTLGWSLMVNVPRRYIWQCLLLTVLGYGLREVLRQQAVNLVLSTFIAAGTSAFLAIYLRKNRFKVFIQAVDGTRCLSMSLIRVHGKKMMN